MLLQVAEPLAVAVNLKKVRAASRALGSSSDGTCTFRGAGGGGNRQCLIVGFSVVATPEVTGAMGSAWSQDS